MTRQHKTKRFQPTFEALENREVLSASGGIELVPYALSIESTERLSDTIFHSAEVLGSINYYGDRDYFSFRAKAGITYEIETHDLSSSYNYLSSPYTRMYDTTLTLYAAPWTLPGTYGSGSWGSSNTPSLGE